MAGAVQAVYSSIYVYYDNILNKPLSIVNLYSYYFINDLTNKQEVFL